MTDSSIDPRVGMLSGLLAAISGVPALNLMVASAIAAGYWLVNYGVPKHLDQIQSGYREIAEENNKVHVANAKRLDDIESRHESQIKQMDVSRKEALDRQESFLREIFDKPKKPNGDTAVGVK